MNWYKKSQQLELIQNNEIKGKGKHYTDIGHDAYWGKSHPLGDTNLDYTIQNPNILWIYNNGKIETKPEIDSSSVHRSDKGWGLQKYLDKLYTGRFSPSQKIITILSPHEGIRRFREIPNSLINLLHQTFPQAEKIIQYGSKIMHGYKQAQLMEYINLNGIFYHAPTKEDFDIPSVEIGSDYDILGKGFYFGTEDYASNYGEPKAFNIEGKFATQSLWSKTLKKYQNLKIDDQRINARQELKKYGLDGVWSEKVGVVWNQSAIKD